LSVRMHQKSRGDRAPLEAAGRVYSAPTLQGGAKKRGHRPTTIILSNLNRFKKNSTGRFLGKFAVKRILQTPLHLAYVATLPCETLMSAKHALNDKLQGSVVACLRCGGVVNNQIKKGLLLTVRVKKLLKSLNIWQSYKQERGCLMPFALLVNALR